MQYRYGRSSNQSAFRSGAALSNELIAQHAPSVLAQEAHSSRGERYTFIPTLAVLEGLRSEGFQPFEVRQTRCRDEGKREFTRHMVRMRHPTATSLTGDEVPEIVLVNSHDGTSSYQIIAGYFRMVCSNGLIAGDVTHDIRVRHTGKVVDDVIEGSFRVIDDMKSISENIQEYKAIQLNKPEQLLLAHAAHEIRWSDGEHSPEPEQLLRAKRHEDSKDDVWTTFNVIQENMLKGGLHGRTATGRRTSTRAVSGVNENVKLNRALWTLTDRFAALKQGKEIPEFA